MSPVRHCPYPVGHQAMKPLRCMGGNDGHVMPPVRRARPERRTGLEDSFNLSQKRLRSSDVLKRPIGIDGIEGVIRERQRDAIINMCLIQILVGQDGRIWVDAYQALEPTAHHSICGYRRTSADVVYTPPCGTFASIQS